jgi:hypothetical protein
MAAGALVVHGAEAAEAVLLQQGDPIVNWLNTLSPRRRAALLQYTASERSPVLSYLYASMLGLEGAGVEDWEAFVLAHYDKQDHRAILDSEIRKLKGDIENIRHAVTEEGGKKIRIGEMPTKVAYLQRELRGHIEQLSKETVLHDRRSLLLAGVDVAAKFLRKVYGKDGSVWPAIEATLEAAWSDIEQRHGAG